VRDAKTSVEVSISGPPAIRRQRRSRTTRRQLIDAAREIFARDGFELARLEDIAAAAGKTRGAFYVHFQDKEDVFFAIFEEDLARDREEIRVRLRSASCREERIEALAAYLATLLRDRNRMLLNLEFKMYAIHHPERQHRLTELHAAMCQRCAETEIDDLLPELHSADAGRKRNQAAQFAAVVDGLALTCLFDPGTLKRDQLLQHLRAGLGIILERTGR
jgi:AcrR family transcriptional regulator